MNRNSLRAMTIVRKCVAVGFLTHPDMMLKCMTPSILVAKLLIGLLNKSSSILFPNTEVDPNWKYMAQLIFRTNTHTIRSGTNPLRIC